MAHDPSDGSATPASKAENWFVPPIVVPIFFTLVIVIYGIMRTL